MQAGRRWRRCRLRPGAGGERAAREAAKHRDAKAEGEHCSAQCHQLPTYDHAAIRTTIATIAASATRMKFRTRAAVTKRRRG